MGGLDPTHGPVDARHSAAQTKMAWLRRALITVTGLAVLASWGVPLLTAKGLGPGTVPRLRHALEYATTFGVQVVRPWAIALVVVSVLAELTAWWSWRQRRRLVRQVTKLLTVRPSGYPVTVLPGWRRPLRGTVPIMPGYVFSPDALAEAGTALSRAWGAHYVIKHDEHRDRIVARRRKAPAEKLESYADEVHKRLTEVLSGAVALKAASVRVIDGPGQDGQETRRYRVTFEPIAAAASEAWQAKVEREVAELVGPTPSGKLLAATWELDRDRVWFAEADQPSYADSVHERLAVLADRGALPKDLAVQDIQAVPGTDNDGEPVIEYELTYEPRGVLTRPPAQAAIADAIAEMVGTGVNGGRLEALWRPEKDLLVMREVPKLESFIRHPVITDYEEYLHTNRLVIPYGGFAGGKPMLWDIDPKSTAPHVLLAGPTGAGKTGTERSLITSACRRGIPFVCFDPKYFELMEFENFPGILAVISEPMHMVDGVVAAYEEHQERKRVIRRERLDSGNLAEVPLWGLVFDELLVMFSIFSRLARRDPAVKAADPIGRYKELIAEVRATGGRMITATQRPDAEVWGSGSARMNMGTRIALSKMDPDGDEMMFPGGGWQTRHLKQGMPGRAIATMLDGTPREGQVWWTPNLDDHPKKRSEREAEDQAIIDSLRPAVTPSVEFFLPRTALGAFYTDGSTYGSPAPAPAPPTRPAEREGVPAWRLEPGWVVVLDMDNTDVVCTLIDVEENGAQVDLEIEAEGERGTYTVDRDEYIGIVDRRSRD
jgi:hypothetical protein